MTLYDTIGKDYNQTRQPDGRIVDELIGLLSLSKGSTIADVGAGTGNYSLAIAQKGYRVIAIEPSTVMQSQAQDHPNLSWIKAEAENIPLSDSTVDGVVVMLALHHFSNLEQGIREINRICSGNMVIFAFEQDKIPDFWLANYFPYFIRDTKATFPSTQNIVRLIERVTNKQTQTIPFLLPADLRDLFAASGWCRPEIYLDDRVRHGISSFAKMPERELEEGLRKLSLDLRNGRWQEQYGYLLQQENYDAGYRIIFTKQVGDRN